MVDSVPMEIDNQERPSLKPDPDFEIRSVQKTKISKKRLIILLSIVALIVFLYICGVRLYLPPYGHSHHQVINTINYSKIDTNTDNYMSQSGILPDYSKLPPKPILEFDISWPEPTLFNKMFDLIFPIEIMKIAPVYRYTIDNNRFVLGPLLSCDSLKNIKLIFLNRWYNEYRLIDDFPQEYKYTRGNEEIIIKFNSVNPDGSVNLDFNHRNYTLQVDQVIKETEIVKLLTAQFIEMWNLRNWKDARVQCFPEYVSDVKLKDDLLRSEANTKMEEKYCQQITTVEVKKACYTDIYSKIITQAINTKNSDLCENIDPANATYDVYSRCYRDLAEAMKNVSLCQKISATESALRTSCYILSTDREGCLKIADDHEKAKCIEAISYHDSFSQK